MRARERSPRRRRSSSDACRGLPPGGGTGLPDPELGANVSGADDPRPAASPRSSGRCAGRAAPCLDCHGVWPGRPRLCARAGAVARRPSRPVAALERPGCGAGFAHGLVSGLAEQIDRPSQVRPLRLRRRATRYQRYSCIHGLGHAFMRIHGDRLPRHSSSAARSARTRPTAPRAPTTTTGSPSSAPTRRRSRQVP